MSQAVQQQSQKLRYFRFAVLASNATQNQAAVEILSGGTVGGVAVNYEFKVEWLSVSVNAGTSSTFSIGRPAAAGITPAGFVTLSEESSGGDASECSIRVATSWGTSPTNPTVLLARYTTSATIGNGKDFQFENLWVPPGKSLVVQYLSATPAALNVMGLVAVKSK